jgi:hypothetical protein
MKKIICLAATLILAAGLSLRAEDQAPQPKGGIEETETLFSSTKDHSISGYGSLLFQGSRMGESYVCLPGFRGALIVDNIAIGISGYGLSHPTHRNSISGGNYSGTEPYINLGYGGLLLEYHFMPKQLVNFSAGVTVGAGGYSFSDRSSDDGDDHRDRHHAKAFFYIEPEAAAYVNVSKFCRVGAAVSYRYFRGAGKAEFANNDFNNIGATCMASFGWF